MKQEFFQKVRATGLFGAKLTQTAVDGLEALYDITAPWPVSWRAYALATAYWETGRTMQPIKEWGSNKYLDKYDTGELARRLGNTPKDDDDGILYAGRGYVQITGKANYSKFQKLLNVPLLENPDLALNDDVAAKILFLGMSGGLFTGVGLKKYLPSTGKATLEQFIASRRIINGVDKATDIARIAIKFQECL